MVLINEKAGIQLISYATVNKDDVREKYLTWLNDINIIEGFGPLNFLYPKGENIIEQSFDRFTSENTIGFFIYDTKTNNFVGTSKLDKISLVNRSVEIGIMIGEASVRGQGVGKITYGLLLDYAFKTLGVNRVWGTCFSFNIGSKRLFESLGFSFEGSDRDAIFRRGEYWDNLRYSILRREYIRD